MFMQKRAIYKSLITVGLIVGAVGCGSKVAGTYTFASLGVQYQSCAGLTLPITENSNSVSATGSNGICTASLQGTDSNGSIIVSSFTIQMTNSGYTTGYNNGYNTGYNNGYNNQCIYTGTLTVSNNLMSGTLTSPNSGLCTPMTISGNKTN